MLTYSAIGYSQSSEFVNIDDEISDENLVKDIFLKGFCSNVSNVQLIGVESSVGHFTNGQNIIGIEEGVIISTGDIAAAQGRNDNNQTTTIVGTEGDVDLQLIATEDVYDAGGITFDFIPVNNTVSFTYVFASEEYCEFVNSTFNDVFGFFVSGPGIDGEYFNGAINVATLPLTNEFVAINSVNHLKNQEYYVRNEPYEDIATCDISFGAEHLEEFQFDGFTVPLKAEFTVEPCETYTIRLVVGDVSDYKLDSAVFLEMNSFDIGGNLKISARSEDYGVPVVSEGCSNGIFIFERPEQNSELEETIRLLPDINNTAELGTDIEVIPSSITFAAGETIVELPIIVKADTELETQETFTLSLDYPCLCRSARPATLLINDASYFQASFEEVKACEDQEFALTPLIRGGAPPYEYKWSNNSELDTTRVRIGGPSDFEVTITDVCGRTTDAFTTITLKNPPEIAIDGEYKVCEGTSVNIPIQMDGKAPYGLSYQIDGGDTIHVRGIPIDNYSLRATEPGTYTLARFNDLTCEGIVDGSATVLSEDIIVRESITPPSCPNLSDGSIAIDVDAKYPIESIRWIPETTDNYMIQNLKEDFYKLIIRDEAGCRYDNTYDLRSLKYGDGECEDLNVYIPNIFSPNIAGQNEKFLIQFGYDPTIVLIDSFIIYDRWGNQLFKNEKLPPSTTDIGFSDTFNGKELPVGIYGYITTVSLRNGNKKTLQGTVSLIR